MPKLFKNNTTESAKDYIEKKRNKRLYCDTANNNTEGRYLAKWNTASGRLKSATNHSSLLNITKGMFQHRHDNKVNCYYHPGKIETETFKSQSNCHENNSHTNANFTQDLSLDNDTKYSKNTEYSSVQSVNVAELKKDIKTSKVKINKYPIARLLKYKP